MLRIAHISDLHLLADSERNAKNSLLALAKAIGKKINSHIELDGHNEHKLQALLNIFDWLQPNIIVVTGDLTDVGDTPSFELARKTLEELKRRSNASRIICVPGNHDTLEERTLLSWRTKIKDFFSRSTYETRDLFSERKQGIKYLKNYLAIIEKSYGKLDPGEPIIHDFDWGRVAFFLFNSNTDSAVMWNEGNIGPAQFNASNSYLQNHDCARELDDAIKIALLHHHPISAPSAEDPAVMRFYNWMKDGPRFISFLNQNRFHLILHGHQHVPYECRIDYCVESDRWIHLLAAGSALKGTGKSHESSFNVIDLLSPYEARFQKFTYEPTGYAKKPEIDIPLSIWPPEKIAELDSEIKGMAGTVAVPLLMKGRSEGIDEIYKYSLVSYTIEVTKDYRYVAEYRRKGIVQSPDGAKGPVFVITGDPGMMYEDMHTRAIDVITGKNLELDLLHDDANQRVIRVLHRTELKQGEEMDIALEFQWQASKAVPIHYDVLNHMYFRHVVDELAYNITLPVQASQFRVRAIGTTENKPNLTDFKQDENNGAFSYGFSINKPKPVVYFIFFKPSKSPEQSEEG